MSTKSIKNSKTTTPRDILSGQFGERFRENVPLSQITRAAVGGVAEYVVEAQTLAELTEIVRAVTELKLPYQIIGGASGVLASTVGFAGLIILNRTSQVYFTHGSSIVIVESGVTNTSLLASAAAKGLGGIEFLSAVPGSIGGAIVTNAGYNNQFIGSYVRDITLLVPSPGEPQMLTVKASELNFQPGSSALLAPGTHRPIVLSVRLQLTSLYQEEIMHRLQQYRSRSKLLARPDAVIGSFLKPFFETEPTLHREAKRRKVPNVTLDPTTGVIFAKNGRAQSENYRELINLLKQLGNDYGIELEERLSYLGYWPDEGDQTSV